MCHMVSVLFVDDDIAGLHALRDAYGETDLSWQTGFVPGPDIALDIMDDQPVDAVVSSCRLSAMSAASFLRLTKLKHPQTARIAMSNPSDRGAMLSTLPVANHCLEKGCAPPALADAVKRTTALHGKLFSAATRKMVAELGGLPSLPSTLAAVDAALSDEDCSLNTVADIMSGDVAIVAKVLQLVNSSFFGLRAEIRDLRHAVSYLGVGALRDFAVAGTIFRTFKPSGALPSDWLPAFNSHSMAVADLVSQLLRTPASQCEANVAGALHDIGELVTAERAPDKLLAIAQDVTEGMSPDDAEVCHIGTTFPVIAGYLLSQWGMGHNVVEAVSCQRETWAGAPRPGQLADFVRVADHLATTSALAATGNGPSMARVCLASSVTPTSEGYQELVGVRSAVRLYEEGFVHLH